MQSWCRTWPPNGSSRIRPKRKLLRKPKGACKSSWSRTGSLKSFTLTVPWSLTKPVKIFPGITVRQAPHRSETHGIAERAVRRVKEGTSAVLLQTGLDKNWWPDSMECFPCPWNVTAICETFKISCLMGRLHTKDVSENLLKDQSFRLVHWLSISPISAKDQSRIHLFGKKVLPGLFLGYALYAGRIRKGDVQVADVEELETMDASEIYSKRLNAKEVIFHKKNGFTFPVADGRIKFVGGYQELRPSNLIQNHPIRGEGHRDFLGESEGSPPSPPQDSYPDAGEAINDFWTMSVNFTHRRHVEPRVKLYSPREESFPIPLKYIDVSRTTHTNFGCQARETHR